MPVDILDAYLSLDDNSILSLLKKISSLELGRATTLAKRFFDRDLFKSIDVPIGINGEIPSQQVRAFRSALDQADIWYKIDKIKSKGYKEYGISNKSYLENILVKDGAEHVGLHTRSLLVKNVPYGNIRFYFDGTLEKRAAELIFKSLKVA
jgi:hypothetical protein